MKLIEGNIDEEGSDTPDGFWLVFREVGIALEVGKPDGLELAEGEVGDRLELGLDNPDGS